ncbi:hypothetical protein Tco_1390651, partial [Tanacetum coccineum]
TENQGRKIQDIDDDPLVSLVRESMKEKEEDFSSHIKASASREAQEEDISPTILEASQILSQVVSQSVSTYKRRTRSANKVNTGNTPVSTPSVIQTVNVIVPSPIKSQREGKAPMTSEDEQELSEQQQKRKAKVQEAAQFYTEEDWDTIRAKLEANT